MRILVQLGHPAQFHFFKNGISIWENKGHQVKVLIRTKDVLEELLISSKISYVNIEKVRFSRDTKFQLFILALVRLKQLFSEFIRFRPNIVISPDPVLSVICKIIPTKFITVGEDDYMIIKKLATYLFPNVNHIIAPKICDYSPWQTKKIEFDGYMKLAYLHPNYFSPNRELISGYIGNEKYVIIRLVSLTAHHDNGINGINELILSNLINIFENNNYKIYISSEKGISERFRKFQLTIPVYLMHNLLAFSSFVICDSQSMAVESAMLGIPSIRFNDFAGKISVLEELEHKYNLTFGINTKNENQLYNLLNSLLLNSNLENEFSERRKKMLSDKIDVTAFFVWFIENYPESANIMRKNPDYQYNFK